MQRTRGPSTSKLTAYRILVESNGTDRTIVHYAKRMEKMAISQTNGTGGGDTCGLEVGIARFRSETETGIGGMPLE